ncbi:hypothetical protein T4A_3975 [Trichinella pseudospiralis]|uniref:Uncharacterized protein n=1 Tax=Trichinella pseudospiralis TaxID=6337 RepID=A0A0V1DTM7_TRIPS|nr:hypothetical protein T4A_3975 [Trichinella pseudospiralis]
MLAVIGVGVLRLLRNKRLTPPIMTRFDDVNKKVQKGATLSTALQFGKVISTSDDWGISIKFTNETLTKNQRETMLNNGLMPMTSPNSWILFFAVVCHFSTNSNSSIAETTDFK